MLPFRPDNIGFSNGDILDKSGRAEFTMKLPVPKFRIILPNWPPYCLNHFDHFDIFLGLSSRACVTFERSKTVYVIRNCLMIVFNIASMNN